MSVHQGRILTLLGQLNFDGSHEGNLFHQERIYHNNEDHALTKNEVTFLVKRE